MHKNSNDLLQPIRQSVKSVRSETMDQTELGKRVGVSRTTIDERSVLVKVNRSRKARKAPEELSDDF